MSNAMRLPPQNLDAERRTLGSMMLERATIDDVATIVAAGDFYRDSHQAVFRSILSLHESGSPVDTLAVAEQLRRCGLFDSIGGDDTLREIHDATPHAADATYCAEIVRQKAIVRHVIEEAHKTISEGFSDRFSSDEILERFERRALAIGQDRRAGELVGIGEMATDAARRAVEQSNTDPTDRRMTGFGDLDSLIGGLWQKNLVVLAARPSMGKTAMGFSIAVHVARSQRVPVLFISLEMGRAELANRLLSIHTGIPCSKIQRPKFASDEQLRQLEEAAPMYHDVPMWVDDRPAQTMSQIASTARRFKSRYGLGLLAVDYLQFVGADDPRAPRHEQVAATSRRFKILSQDLDVPILALAQLNREVEKREDRIPKLADLKESSQIEQDADVVMLLHRPEYYDRADRPGLSELIVAKNRNGATGTINLVFEGPLMRFSDLAVRFDPAY